MTITRDAGSEKGVSWVASSESSIHNVLNTSSCLLHAPLQASLLLSRGTGSPTFTRATKSWGFNELGYLEELASGCAFFGGARLVRNAISTKSEDITNAAWVKTAVTTPSVNTVVCSAATSAQSMYNSNNYSVTLGSLVQIKARLTYVDTAFVQFRSGGGLNGTAYTNFDLVNGSYSLNGAGGIAASITAVSVGVYDCTFTYQTTNTITDTAFYIGFVNSLASTRASTFTGDGVKSFGITRAQVCDVTGYPDTYIPEYVPVGVVSSPFFGAGIDGAKYFSTGWNGAPLTLQGFRREAAATNNLLGGRDFFINWTPAVVAGTLFSDDFSSYADTAAMTAAGWTAAASTTQALSSAAILITNAGAVYGSSSKALTTEVGKSYLVTFAFTKTTANCGVYAANTAVASSIDRLNNVSATVTGAYSLVFTATATTTYLVFGLNSNTVGHEIKIDDVLVKESKVTVTKATGLDGIANTATTLTASAADAIILQPITLASAARCASAYVKRITGTGTVSFTQDGGSTWTDITSQINSSTWSRVQVTATLANPSVGFKISTSGDAIDVDCVQNEAGSVATSPIVTTTATVTRNADSLTYQTASNWSDTAGTAFVEVAPLAYSGGAIGSATNGLLLSTSNSGATAYDGTNSANGPSGTPGSSEKLAFRWGGSAMTVSSGGVIGTPGTYDGGMGLSSIEVGSSAAGFFKNAAIYNYAMTDAELRAVTA